MPQTRAFSNQNSAFRIPRNFGLEIAPLPVYRLPHGFGFPGFFTPSFIRTPPRRDPAMGAFDRRGRTRQPMARVRRPARRECRDAPFAHRQERFAQFRRRLQCRALGRGSSLAASGARVARSPLGGRAARAPARARPRSVRRPALVKFPVHSERVGFASGSASAHPRHKNISGLASSLSVFSANVWRVISGGQKKRAATLLAPAPALV